MKSCSQTIHSVQVVKYEVLQPISTEPGIISFASVDCVRNDPRRGRPLSSAAREQPP
ncbi:hypothetical protein R69776_06353 [Paraburkholderia nemoris]|uniref:Uncharacterized protein n=1 Tax=Paraburkholderia nemoris TaxID=2793076 RepID=A0ABM8SQQ5_9BURK|nr:hypothetical protein R75777_06008 [Paraburkholderia nemoris]CAE6825645.1 hypothetical protein R69776_06353 [Paraburkholderia nemoris]